MLTLGGKNTKSDDSPFMLESLADKESTTKDAVIWGPEDPSTATRQMWAVRIGKRWMMREEEAKPDPEEVEKNLARLEGNFEAVDDFVYRLFQKFRTKTSIDLTEVVKIVLEVTNK